MNKFRKLGAAGGVVLAVLMATATMASAEAPTVNDALESGAESLQAALISVAMVVIPIAATIAAIPLGWRWVRKFVK